MENQEIQQVENESFADLFEESLKNQVEVKEGEVISGTVLEIGRDFVLLDIGYKSEASVAINEFKTYEGDLTINQGDSVDVFVENREDDAGLVTVSKEKADKLKVWDDIAAACEQEQVVDGKVIARVKGGLSVDIGVKAFLPGSQVDLRPVRNLEKLIGETHKFKVIKFNKKRGNIVLSRRALLEADREQSKAETLKKIGEGEILNGIVKNITDYGAFIDLGGIDGLLHITDMSWGRLNHPSEVFTLGQEIKVKVLKFDSAAERVSLGFKQITEDPWGTAAEKFPVHGRVAGKVVSITDYGAFIEIESGVEGLVHVSEMSWSKRVKHPSKLLTVGDDVEAIVLDIDLTQKRISLGIKQLEENPWDAITERYPIGAVIKGTVRNITDFGVFVGVEDGIDGLVHISDLSWTHRVKHPGELYKKGDEIEAVVLNVDIDNERFSLGVKQLTDDPWDILPKRFPRGTKVDGRVVKLTDYGAFVEIEPGIDGLVHVSELSEDRINNPNEVLKPGDSIEVLVLDVDAAERRVSLSLKAALDGTSDYRAYMSQESEGRAQLGHVLGEHLSMAAAENAEAEAAPAVAAPAEAAPAEAAPAEAAPAEAAPVETQVAETNEDTSSSDDTQGA
ncbi:MAG: 30S ribosomal protein S1 [Myxococcota bacterium]|nr:30S ribosomal protein S1 [Myxococcota bacterium]